MIRQVAEFQIRVAVLDGFTALGIPVTKAVGWLCLGKGRLGHQLICATVSACLLNSEKRFNAAHDKPVF